MSATLNLRCDFADCQTNAERAAWLLSASIWQLVHCQNDIRMVLRRVQFHEGLAYLEAEFREFGSDRREDGFTKNLVAISCARGRMTRIADGLPPLEFGSACASVEGVRT